MKTIYAIYGKADTGKSETLKMFYEKIKAKYTTFKISNKYTHIDGADISVALEINGKLVAIESQGDPNSRILDSLPKFAAIPADIIICVTRTRGATVNIVKQQKDNYKIVWIDKKRSTSEASNYEVNNKEADDLMLRLEGLLN